MLGCKSSAENDSVICAECPFTTFYLKHNIPLPAADHMDLLVRAVFQTQRKLRSLNLPGRRHQPLHSACSHQPKPTACSYQPLPQTLSHQLKPIASSYHYQPLSPAWSDKPLHRA
ncbi:hypothetical protein PoB_003109000 [Plakobranchus ocellatus]|uniref:Uncharacterized protein n=1 Tax=Plakobranchus ocellatus TaxID=259542 RepID=A0AAV4A8T5_9GAST|nr:hypothetical protein PoB_003109000 [Plakobranchus ocellatus]